MRFFNFPFNYKFITFLMYNSTKQQLEKQLAIDIQLQQHILLVSSLLKDLIFEESLDFERNSIAIETIFDCKQKPDIALDDYLRRVHKLTKFSSQSLILAIIIMDRYNIENDSFHLNQINVHRLLLACLILAVKIHDDFYFDNKAFQTAGGVNVVMLQKYELQIFEKCHYNLHIDEQEYKTFLQNLYNVYSYYDNQQTEEQN